MKLSKAKVAKVKLGDFEIEALMMPNGDYRVGVSQVANVFDFSVKNSSRDIKALLGSEVEFSKVKSEINPKPVNTISVSEFNKVVMFLAFKGDPIARDLMLTLSDLSMTEVFNDAFEVANTAETRQQFLKARFFGKVQRRKFTDSVQKYQQLHGYESKLEYARLTNIIYMALWGRTASQLEIELGKPVRDHLDPESLHRLEKVEDLAGNLMLMDNMKPDDAVKKAVLLTN
jgi:hypothetical protein